MSKPIKLEKPGDKVTVVKDVNNAPKPPTDFERLHMFRNASTNAGDIALLDIAIMLRILTDFLINGKKPEGKKP